MLRIAIVAALALLPLSATAATTASPPLYPSFTTAPAKPSGMPGTIYPSFHSPKAESSPTITTFNVPGARNTEPFAINDSGVVTGIYSTSREFFGRGFVRAADGTITTFDAPGWTSSNKYQIVPLSINSHGVIAGYISYGSDRGSGFIRLPDGTIKKIWAEPDHKHDTVLWAIGNSGAAVGTYNDGTGQCFIRRASGVLKFIKCGPYGGVSAINSSDAVTGMFGDVNQAYVRAADGTYAKFHADQVGTTPVGINASGTIAGYFESGGTYLGFFRTPDGVVKKFHDPSFVNTEPAGINDAGVIVGNLQTSPGPNVGFTRTADGTITTYNLPDANGSMEGINNSNVIVGYYYKKDSPYGPSVHGFLMTP